MNKAKVTITDLKAKKEAREKITMLTAYDYPMAKAVDEAGIDIILVGDSLGMVVLGYDDTLSVTIEDMIHHTKAVNRGAEEALIVTDMPFMSYKTQDVSQTVKNAGKIIKESGAQAVKLEGGEELAAEIRAVVEAGIPVMGHLGLTPQSINQVGGFKVQARENKAAKKLVSDAKALEEAGVFALVLECIPAALAKEVTEAIGIPTIGIGAGKEVDGQVLVTQDMLGIFADFTPKFVRKYANLNDEIKTALKNYKQDVKAGEFPTQQESF
ncbi:3-methyl-2-oxobutanoate hydroxymethyltransferase [Sporohalobacter salinus]|uniref:3-methyl-2-oxobutanoate hydroxymethyltransferase n=1 Tax=Sporohalobacter salinus TaxID=1494606 RepID=UPI0019600406|nr:3-methyl-2-oxobutanoate hydroxymethyltransferase [Sporohalobacter salinus]MBM7625020.1 3-methyl-2-oxobutanoate hydroxymethyltransferase [Sporohalobacter salinus]